MAYNGISFVTDAWKMMINSEAMAASATMPREKTRRLPRNASWRGRKPSFPTNALSRGKSAKAVLAAITRITVVAAITIR